MTGEIAGKVTEKVAGEVAGEVPEEVAGASKQVKEAQAVPSLVSDETNKHSLPSTNTLRNIVNQEQNRFLKQFIFKTVMVS